MPEKDPAHWLYRLSPDEWLRAAENELAAARQAFAHKQQRGAVAQARRAAGMALNAALWGGWGGEAYGRSYVDHLAALAKDETVPEELRADAQKLLEMPMQQQLVTLGKGDVSQADGAGRILAYARRLVHPETPAGLA